jgi:cell wall-associated NlpC family hydrolase
MVTEDTALYFMQFSDQSSHATYPDLRVRQDRGRLTAILFIALLAGCGSNKAYRAPVKQGGVIREPQRASQAATNQRIPDASRSGKQRPNYYMAMVAKQMVGVRYRYGGTSPSSGFDCSGLIYYSYKRIGLRSPRTTRDLYRHARPVRRSNIRTGDILFFKLDGKRVSHAAIYLDNDRMVHAPSNGKRVSYAQLTSRFWDSRFVGAGRLH